MKNEALIKVGDVTLTHAQSITVRVALASFNTDLTHNGMGLGEDEHGKSMTEAYRKSCVEIERLIDNSIQAQQPKDPKMFNQIFWDK